MTTPMLKTFLIDNFIPPSRRHSLSPATKPRLQYIDLAKGICIILVMSMHIGFLAYPFLAFLRMPLYFFLSGLFFKQYDSFQIFLKKKINNLIIPMFFFELCMIIPKFLTGGLPVSQLLPSLFCIELVNFPLWFLGGLFIVNLIYYWISKICNEILIIPVVIACAIIGYVLSLNECNILLIGSAFSALPLFHIGHISKRFALIPLDNDVSTSPIRRLVQALSPCVFLILIAVYQLFTPPILSIPHNEYSGNPILFYLFSSFTVISFIWVCSLIKWLPVVSYFGRFSIITLGLHVIFMCQGPTPVYWLTGFAINSLYLMALTFIGCWLSIPIFRKYFPYFTAQKNLFDLLNQRDYFAQLKLSR